MTHSTLPRYEQKQPYLDIERPTNLQYNFDSPLHLHDCAHPILSLSITFKQTPSRLFSTLYKEMAYQFSTTSTTFQLHLPLSTSGVSENEVAASYDLITFLAVAQKLRLGLLPIMWRSKLPSVGKGAKSQINQDPLNIEASFAFKRVADVDKQTESWSWIFWSLVNEIIVLCDRSIRNHPFMVELEGFCWDVPFAEVVCKSEEPRPEPPCKTQVWPVLVFEKSQFGDLYNFARTPLGRRLGVDERVRFCLSIGLAIEDLHSIRKNRSESSIAQY